MRKNLVLLVLMLLVCFNSKAVIKDLPSYNVGVRASFLSSSNMLSDNTTGFVMPGLAFDVKLGSIPLYFESGVYYTKLNYAEKYYSNDSDYTVIGGNDNSVLVPLLASYHVGFDSKLVLQPFAGFLFAYGFDSERTYAGARIGCGLSYKRFYANVGFDLLGLLSQTKTFERPRDGQGNKFWQSRTCYYYDDLDDCLDDDFDDWCDWNDDWRPNVVGNFFITLGVNFTSF